jgi:tetratricopeptide (TPR) repeat protein
MLEGLKDNEESVDSNGNVTPYSLNRYISKKINSLPAEKRPRQKPLMRSETSGEIILASYPKKQPTLPIMPIPNSPTKSSEAEVHKGILGSKPKILIGVGIAAVVAVVLTLALFNQPQQTLLNNRNAFYNIGTLFFGQGFYTQAIQYFDKALHIDPNFRNALYAKGHALNYLGNYTQAIRILDRALAINASDENALNDRGYALNGLGNYKEAITYLNKALAIDPKYKWPFYNKAYALNGLGNYKEAITYLNKALAIDPNFKDALNIKGAILDSLGNATKFQKYAYGIKMQYPSDWSLSDFISSPTTDNRTYPMQNVVSLSPQRDYTSQVLVVIEKLTTRLTPNQYLNKVMSRDVSARYSSYPDIRFSQNTTNNIVLAGHPGYMLNGTYRDSTSDALQKFTNIGTTIGDKAYFLIYNSPAYTYPVYLPTFTQIIKSFEVIPQKN